MGKIKLFLRVIHALAKISDNLQSLNETLIAQTMMTKDKPAMFTGDVDRMDITKVKSPLLIAYLRTRQYSATSKTEITYHDLNREYALAKQKEADKLFKPWAE